MGKQQNSEINVLKKEVQSLRQAILDAQHCKALDLSSVQFHLLNQLGMCERAMRGLVKAGLSDGQTSYYLRQNEEGFPVGEPDAEEQTRWNELYKEKTWHKSKKLS